MVAFLPGCMDRIYLEDATLSLMIGIDLNEKNELLFYLSSPVFSKEAKKKAEEFGVKADSLRQSRARLDEMVTALTVPGKVQVFVLGKRLLQHPDWFKLMDVVFRDAKFTVNARMVAFDGPVHELFHFNPKDKPRLALHLTKLIDTANQRNLSVKTRVQELHRQMFEKGMTATLTEMKKEKAVKIMGTALLDEKGRYATLLQQKENLFLQMLLHGKQGEISLTIPTPDQEGGKKIVKKRVGFLVKSLSKKVKTDFVEGRFRFDVHLDMRVTIAERLFPFDMEKEYKKMEQMIEEELRKEFAKTILKCQQSKTDPFGFGLYARAYQYKEWKKVQDNWTEAFADATVSVDPEVSIKGNGITK
jgi:Ger(x)C family germination protein